MPGTQSGQRNKIDTVRAVDGREPAAQRDINIELAFSHRCRGLLAGNAGDGGQQIQRSAGGCLKKRLPLHQVQGKEEPLKDIGGGRKSRWDGACVPLVVVVRDLRQHIVQNGPVLCGRKIDHAAVFTSVLACISP